MNGTHDGIRFATGGMIEITKYQKLKKKVDIDYWFANLLLISNSHEGRMRMEEETRQTNTRRILAMFSLKLLSFAYLPDER
jgi:hypothetical protein